MKQQLSSARPKPVLDQEAFQQLLEAAYVIQQQNDKAHGSSPKPDSARVLSEIIETQRLIQAGQLDLPQAMKLIVDRLHSLTASRWTAAAFVEGNELHYRAISSSVIGLVAQPVPLEACAAQACLRTGEVLRYSDLTQTAGANFETYRSRGIESLVVAPVYSEGEVTGVIEAGFPRVNGFEEKDVSTCQLMSGLLTEAMSRAAESEWKQALAAERATMLETLERIKPQLERLVEPVVAPPVVVEEKAKLQSPAVMSASEAAVIGETSCRGCGNRIGDEEAFCGLCGLPSPKQKPTGDIQSKWASLWHMQQAAEKKKGEQLLLPDIFGDSHHLEEGTDAFLALRNVEQSLANETAPEEDLRAQASDTEHHAIRILPHEEEPAVVTPSPWTSATSARKWFESLKPREDKKLRLLAFWHRQRANIYLGASVLLLITVIAGWDSAGATSRKNPNRLSLFDRTLIALNLAEAPPAPVYHGNPQTQVWVDLHTALYYCPGEDLYGKTPDGKMTTQKDAQLDNFAPALRKACN